MHEAAAHKQETSRDTLLEEIRTWIAGELKKKTVWEERGKTGQAYNVNAENINPDDLTDEDLEMWEQVKTGAATEDDLKRYHTRMEARFRGLDDDEDETKRSREAFADLIGDRIAAKVWAAEPKPGTKKPQRKNSRA